MYGVVSQAQLSLDNSGMHIFTASQASIGLRHHFLCCDGATVQILPSWKTISLLLFSTLGNVSLLSCFAHQKGSLGHKTTRKASHRGLGAQKQLVHMPGHKRSRWNGGARCVNESSCRSLDRCLPLSISALAPHHRSLPSVHRPDGGGPRPCHFGAYSSLQGGKLKLDGGLLLSESNPHAFLAGCARHTCRLLVLWLLQAGTHGIVDGCCRVERPCRAIAVDGDVVPVVG